MSDFYLQALIGLRSYRPLLRVFGMGRLDTLPLDTGALGTESAAEHISTWRIRGYSGVWDNL